MFGEVAEELVVREAQVAGAPCAAVPLHSTPLRERRGRGVHVRSVHPTPRSGLGEAAHPQAQPVRQGEVARLAHVEPVAEPRVERAGQRDDELASFLQCEQKRKCMLWSQGSTGTVARAWKSL